MDTNSNDIQTFKTLLRKVSEVFLQRHSASSTDMSQWKGQDIVLFQEDLRQKTQASISEKWFYTYVKNTPEKLPRIDMLNMLSQYCGYESWNAFKKNHRQREKMKLRRWAIPILFVVFLVAYSFFPRKRTFNFCFVDADQKTAITNIAIDIIILNKSESPIYTKTDSLGCFTWETKDDHIRFVAQSPYHKNDTIYRTISGQKGDAIQLRTDDYALMLHYYGNNNVKDWKKRRQQLNQLIANEATIFEVLPHQLGVELYSKQEFIDKLSTPTEGLKRMQVLQTEYREEKIVKLKFKLQ